MKVEQKAIKYVIKGRHALEIAKTCLQDRQLKASQNTWNIRVQALLDIETLLKAFHSRTTTKKRSKMDIIEDPIFKKSHLRNLIQLADMIAYMVHKHYRSNIQFENWFNGLKHKMYQPNGNLNGFGLNEFP